MKLLGKKEKNTRSPSLIGNHKSLPVNNYYRSSRAKINSTEVKSGSVEEKKKISISFTKVFNIFLVAIGVGIVVYATTLTTSPTIELRKTDAAYYEEGVYQNAASVALKKSILNRSKLLFQQTAFENTLKQEFPEISQVKPVIPIGGRDLAVIITVSEPFAVVSSGLNTGIVNKEGVLVVKNTKNIPEGLLTLRFTDEQSNFDVGNRIFTSDELKTLKKLETEMNTLTFKDGSTADIKDILFNVSEGQLEAQLQNKPFYIRLSTFSEGDQQIGGAKATLKQLDNEDALPAEYIDVRVPGRAFVK